MVAYCLVQLSSLVGKCGNGTNQDPTHQRASGALTSKTKHKPEPVSETLDDIAVSVEVGLAKADQLEESKLLGEVRHVANTKHLFGPLGDSGDRALVAESL